MYIIPLFCGVRDGFAAGFQGEFNVLAGGAELRGCAGLAAFLPHCTGVHRHNILGV